MAKLLFTCLSMLLTLSPVVAGQPASEPQKPPASSSPAIEAAAKDLCKGNLDVARKEFGAIADDKSAEPFVRSLAMFGIADAALARNDFTGANAELERLASDAALPQSHRDIARRRLMEIQRLRQGLPARNPASYREKLPVLAAPAAVFYVAPDGTDTANGSKANPFHTLEQARNAVRTLKKSHNGRLPKGGVRINIRGGLYAVGQSLSLTSEDSGTSKAPIVYQAVPGETPVFSGGVKISNWTAVSDARIRNRLDASVRDRVLQADLKAVGVTNFGDATKLRHRPELFADGKPQTLARWPNEGFVKTGEPLGKETFKVWGSIDGCKDGKFRYLEDRPSRWLDEPDVRLYGYWFWDWYEEYQKVASIDAQAKTFTLSRPYSNYGYRKGQRYYAVNVLCELDRPGEWYLDRQSGLLYWLPPTGLKPSATETMLSVFDQPFVLMDGVENVIIRGLTLQKGRGDGIHVNGGADCLIAGCTIRQFGGDAIIVQGGLHQGVFGCTMNTLGCGGVRMAGGDRTKLTAGGDFVENCTVFDISRLKRTYTPAVHLDGCGNRIAHNLFYDMPSSAMRIEGNNHVIELNVIRNVVRESDDQGGLDMYGNPLYRGVVIRWNRWSNIGGGTNCGAAGVRLDDMISGVTIYGNVFEKCGAELFGAIQIHGGKDNLVDNNIFKDCFAGVSFSRWGSKRWLDSVEKFMKQASQEPYASRYPELDRLKTDVDVNMICRNLFTGCQSIFLRDGGLEQTALNAVSTEPFTLRDTSQGPLIHNNTVLGSILLDPVPIDEMGPYDHPWRANP